MMKGLRRRERDSHRQAEPRNEFGPDNKPSASIRNEPPNARNLTLRQLGDAVKSALHAAVRPQALVLSRDYTRFLTSRVERKTLGWQAFRVVAEGSYLLAHGLHFDNLVMQVFMTGHLACVLLHVFNRGFWIRWREEICMGMNIMYSTVSFLKLFNVVPRLPREDNFLMKYLVLYLADAYFCQVPVHKFYKLQFADAALRWWWWRLYNVMPGMPYGVLIATSLTWQAFLLTFSASLQAGHVAEFLRLHDASNGAAGMGGPAATPLSTAGPASSAGAVPALLPAATAAGPPTSRSAAASSARAGSAPLASAAGARAGALQVLARSPEPPGLASLALLHEARASLAALSTGDNGALHGSHSHLHLAFAASGAFTHSLLGSTLSTGGPSSVAAASEYMAALSSVGSGPSSYLLSHEPRWSQLVTAALRSGNPGVVMAPVCSSRTGTVQLYLTAADPAHLPPRWVERVAAAFRHGAPGWHLVSASCRRGSLVVHLDLVGITPLEPHTPAQVAQPHSYSQHAHSQPQHCQTPRDLQSNSASEPQPLQPRAPAKPCAPPCPSAPPNSFEPAAVCSPDQREPNNHPGDQQHQSEKLQSKTQVAGPQSGAAKLPPGSREALEAYLDHLDPSDVLDMLGLEGLPEPQLGDVIALQSEGLRPGGGHGRRRAGAGVGDERGPGSQSSSSCGSSSSPAEGADDGVGGAGGSAGCVRLFRVVESRPLRNCATLLRRAEVDRHNQQSGRQSCAPDLVAAWVAASGDAARHLPGVDAQSPAADIPGRAQAAAVLDSAAALPASAAAHPGVPAGFNYSCLPEELECDADTGGDVLRGLRTPELPSRGRRWQKLRLKPSSEGWGDAFGSLGGRSQPSNNANVQHSNKAHQTVDDAIALLESGDVKGINWEQLETQTSAGNMLAELLGTGGRGVDGAAGKAPRVPLVESAGMGAAAGRLRGVHPHAFGERLVSLGVLDSLQGPLVPPSVTSGACAPAAAEARHGAGGVTDAGTLAAAAPWRNVTPHDISLDRRVLVLSPSEPGKAPRSCLKLSFTCPANAVPGIKVVLRHMSPRSFVTGLHCAAQAEEVSRTLEPSALRASGCDTPDAAAQHLVIQLAISSSLFAAPSFGSPDAGAALPQQSAAAVDEGPGLLHVELWHQRRRLSSHPVLLLSGGGVAAERCGTAEPVAVADGAQEGHERTKNVLQRRACGVAAWGEEVEAHVRELLTAGHNAVANQLLEDLGTWLAQVAAIERGLLEEPPAAAAATQRIAQIMHVHHFQGGHVAADLLAAAWAPKGASLQAPNAAVASSAAEGTGVPPPSVGVATRSAGKPKYAGASAGAEAVRGGAPDALLQLLQCQGNMLLAVAVEAGASQLADHLKDLLCGPLEVPLRRVLDAATTPLTSLPLLHAAIKSGSTDMVAQVVGWHRAAGTPPYDMWTAEVVVHATSLAPHPSGSALEGAGLDAAKGAAGDVGEEEDGGDEFFETLLSAAAPKKATMGGGTSIKPIRPPSWSRGNSNSPGGCAVQVPRVQTNRAGSSSSAVSHVSYCTGTGTASAGGSARAPNGRDSAQPHTTPGTGPQAAGSPLAAGCGAADLAVAPLRAVAVGHGSRDREGLTPVLHVQRQECWKADAAEYASSSCAAASHEATALLLGTFPSRSCANSAAVAMLGLACGGCGDGTAAAPTSAAAPREAAAAFSGVADAGTAGPPLVLLDGGLLLVTPLHLALAMPDGGRLLEHILDCYPEAKKIWDASAHAGRLAAGSSAATSLRSSISADNQQDLEQLLVQPLPEAPSPSPEACCPQGAANAAAERAAAAGAAATDAADPVTEAARSGGSFVSDCGTLGTDAATATARTSAACEGSCYSRATSRPSAQLRPVSGGVGPAGSGYLLPSETRLRSAARPLLANAVAGRQRIGGDGGAACGVVSEDDKAADVQFVSSRERATQSACAGSETAAAVGAHAAGVGGQTQAAALLQGLCWGRAGAHVSKDQQ